MVGVVAADPLDKKVEEKSPDAGLSAEVGKWLKLSSEKRDAAVPKADSILLTCDGGGSNSSRNYIFKEDLQGLANRLGIRIRICHYPPYCSKYNPIEHLVFPHVSRACKGVPLSSVETTKYYMEKAETTKGLQVVVRIMEKVYQTGRKYAKDFKKTMTIQFDEHLPKWNYTAIPTPV